MAIDPTTTTTIKVGELQSADFNTTNLIPHEVGGYLKKGNLLDLAHFVKDIIDAEGAIGFRAVEISDGETLPATDSDEFILVGPGTFPNVGGGATITTTEPLNALVSNGTYWFIGVEIPITASGVWGTITGVLTDQTDLNDVLDAKADLIDGKVPNTQLPSYVDDVLEVANFAALPAIGESGKIYVTIDTGNVYRWSGSAYIRIADESPVWGIITGDLADQTDLQDALDDKFDVPTGDTTQYIAGDGTLISFPVAGQAGTLVREVRNTTGATLTKGTIVYISGATGNKPTVSKAIATGDSTSAQTFGMVQANISNNANGYVVCVGDLTGLNTSAITEGAQLYLSSTTAGEYTTTKQLAPAHLVYIGVVTRSHATQGQIEVKIQNGYELDELHDVAISSKTNNQVLVYESSTDLWKNKSLGTILGGTSSQFVKGNGSLDSNTYALDSVVVKLTGDQTIAGTKTFSSAVRGLSFRLTEDNQSGLYYGHTNKVILANYTVGGGIDFETNGGEINMTLNELGNLFVRHNLITGNASDTVNNLFRIDTNKAIFQIEADGATSGAGTKIKYTYGAGAQGSLRFVRALDADTMILDASGNVGIGTTSPSEKLDVIGGALAAGNGTIRTGITYSSLGLIGTFTNHDLGVITNGSERMRITAGGNVGIGFTSPAAKLSIRGADNTSSNFSFEAANGSGNSLFIVRNDGNVGIGTASPSSKLQVIGTGRAFNVVSTNDLVNSSFGNTSGSISTIGFYGVGTTNDYVVRIGANANDFVAFTNDTERMRITSGGNVLIGTTTAGTDLTRIASATGSANCLGLVSTDDASNGGFIQFRKSDTNNIGSISRIGTTNAVSFNTTSDYRLKEDLKEIKGLELVSKIKVYDFKWKDHTDRMDGVIAHELQEVVPYAVTGEKDAKEMQQVDYSKLVPVLVQAIQELKAEIEILKNK